MRMLYDFFTSNGYVFEIILAVGFFTWWMERRKGFQLRVAAGLALLLLVSMVWQLIPVNNVFTKSLQTILFFVLCSIYVKSCFEVAVVQVMFYVTAAGAAQHFSFKAANTFLMPAIVGKENQMLMYIIGYPILFIFFLFLCNLLFGKKLRKEDVDYLTKSPTVLLLLIGLQLSTNVFHNLFEHYKVGYQAYTIFSLFDMVCCLFLLTLQCEIARKENEQQSNEILKHLLYQQKQQMKMSKETIELINIKCHDIKNQMALLGDHVPQDELQELKRAIDIYDTAFKTGNEALDVLLVEKLMLCENKGIRFDCMAEGEHLSFMKHSDIYSLFGNAIDNAIEAVDKLPDKEKRCISIRAKADKGMLMIHFENFLQGELSFESGLPETTKQDKRYHGFGMKSIRMITEKYKGYLSVKAENGIFTLNILLPIPEKAI